MAVGSKKKKKDTYEDKTEVINVEEIKAVSNNKPKFKKYIIAFLVTSFVVGSIYFIIPKIYLMGAKELKIGYGENYKEPGYKATLLFKDISSKVKLNGNIDSSKVGKYEINYSLNYKMLTIQKKRIVNVVDEKEPEIVVESDTLKVCPNKEIPEINYQAIDEYDGDITDKVMVEYLDNSVLLSVSDNAKNEVKKEIIIDRNDEEAPKIVLKGSTNIYLGIGSKYNEPGYTASDNCDGDITDKVVVSGSVGTGAGTYKITYSVTDDNGNKDEVSRTIIVRNNTLYNDGSVSNGAIYLTFDDGPQAGTTNVILDVLKEEGVKATFFVTCGGSDELIKRIYNEGHTLALHTCTHDYYYVYASVNNYFEDLNRVSNRVKNLTGYESKIIRFPGGSSNTVSRITPGIMSTLASMLLDQGYRYYDWNVDSRDAGGAGTSSQVYSNVVNSLRHDRANMVLMHDIKSQTRDAIRNIIRYGKDNGFEFKQITMDTYMIRHAIAN